jgi:hypothetical protein
VNNYILFTCVSDSCSFDSDPDQALRLNTDLYPDSIRIQGFDDQKFSKKFTAEKKNFDQNYSYLSLGFHKERLSYRRSLHPSKENIQHFKT